MPPPDGVLDDWVAQIRELRIERPLLEQDESNLRRSLEALGHDASWLDDGEDGEGDEEGVGDAS